MIKYLELDKVTFDVLSGPWYAEVLPVFAADAPMVAREVLAMPDDYLVAGQVWNDATSELEDTQVSLNNKARWLIAGTDWKVLRHLEQKDRGVTTTLTAIEYETLCIQREGWRADVIE